MPTIKREDILAFLELPEAEGMRTQDIAAKLGCGVTAVKAARAIHDANRAIRPTEVAEGATQQEERDALLLDLLRADQAELDVDDMIEEMKDNIKALKETRESVIGRRRDLSREARKSYPLFEQMPTGVKSDDPAAEPVKLAETA